MSEPIGVASAPAQNREFGSTRFPHLSEALEKARALLPPQSEIERLASLASVGSGDFVTDALFAEFLWYRARSERPAEDRRQTLVALLERFGLAPLMASPSVQGAWREWERNEPKTHASMLRALRKLHPKPKEATANQVFDAILLIFKYRQNLDCLRSLKQMRDDCRFTSDLLRAKAIRRGLRFDRRIDVSEILRGAPGFAGEHLRNADSLLAEAETKAARRKPNLQRIAERLACWPEADPKQARRRMDAARKLLRKFQQVQPRTDLDRLISHFAEFMLSTKTGG